MYITCLEHPRVKMFSVVSDFDRIRVERFKQCTEDKLRNVRCPQHNRPPRLRFHGITLRDVGISMSGCCAKVMEIANARIALAWDEESKAS
jgi:hypothetical protein